MKVSYRWLQALAPGLEATPEALADRLAALGFPVEETESLAAGLGDIVVARVRDVREHPNADRLVLCDVEDGAEVVQVVCGAPNVEPGGWYPFAPVGSTLPGGFRIGKAKLRGEASHGMLCSEKELGLGRDESGIMFLEGSFTPGQPLVDALGLDDVRMDVEVTSNRPDLLSHLGVAREVAPGGVGGVRLPAIPGEAEGAEEALAAVETATGEAEIEAGGVRIRIEAPDRCAAYLGLVIEGVRVGPSPRWLQTRLRAAGARPVNNVVDATNYVLLELGQPLHAFDLARLEDRTIVVRRAAEGEAMRTLDGVDRKLTPEMLAICDAARPVAVAGVMGGEDSEVGEETTDVLLECALFTPGPIRDTRKALGLSTDASYRFERGVDPEGMRDAVLRAARVILATAGGRVAGSILEARPVPFERTTARLRPSRVGALLGTPFSADEIRGLLEPLGFRTGDESDGAIPVEIPGFRSWDVSREVDLIEEVARTYGYDAFPDTLGPFRPGSVPEDPLFLLEDELRGELAARGLLEAHTLAFAPEGEGEVEVLNPISAEERYLRHALLPGLLRRVEYNLARGNRDVRLYELGTVFRRGTRGGRPDESTHLALVLHGRRTPPHWSAEDEPVDVWDLKGLAEGVARAMPDGEWSVRPAGSRGEGRGAGNEPAGGEGAPGASTPGSLVDSSAAFEIVDGEGVVRGRAGRIRADALDLPPWAGAVWGAELALPAAPPARREVRHEPLPQHPGVDRDLALLLDRSRKVAEVEGLARREGGSHLDRIEVFDVYEGEGIPAGKRSVAVRLYFQAGDRTLEDAEVDERVDHLIERLGEELGAAVRGRTS